MILQTITVSTNRFCSGVENSGLEFKDIKDIFLDEKGDKMRGILDMNGNKIINDSNSIENTEVVDKGFVQDFVGQFTTKENVDVISVSLQSLFSWWSHNVP